MRRAADPVFAPAPHGIAALIGGMLGAWLYALLGWLRGGRAAWSAHALEGTLAPVLVAQAEISFETEPYVEWIAVPAPWRNGRLLPKRHAWALSVALAVRCARPFVLGRGPPGRILMFGGGITGTD